MSDANIIMLVFFLYVSAMIGIGVFFMNKNDTIGDYILGGRSLNPWVAAMSAQASDMSGWLLTGLAFLSAAGTKEAVWTAIGLGVGTFAVYELLPVFILSSVVIVAVSLATKAPDQSILDEFDLAKKKQEE